MSFRALVVPEDPTNDRYILKPLVEALLADVGKPRAKIEVLANPRIQGYEHAKRLLLERLLEQYSHRDLLLFLPDSDLRDRSAEFEHLEREASERGARLLCCAAIPEVEVWLLAGHADRLGMSWSEARSSVRLKELVFEPFLDSHGDPRRAGGGRDILMKTTLQNLPALYSRCTELQDLRSKLEAVVQ
ncbi:MAG: hypothetical protein IT454_22875 [Planctomycetes bacterium]|nr:hypothetical protein [Planctomycetota bacterium]